MESNQPPATYQIAMLPLQHRTVSRAGKSRNRLAHAPNDQPAAGAQWVTVTLPSVCSLIPCSSSSYGSRTHLSGLKGQYPAPIDERAACAPPRDRATCSGSGGARILVSWSSGQALNRLSYQPVAVDQRSRRKKARYHLDTGPSSSWLTWVRPSVTSAGGVADYPRPARNNPSLCVLGSNWAVRSSWKAQPAKTCQRHQPRISAASTLLYSLDAGWFRWFTGSLENSCLKPI